EYDKQLEEGKNRAESKCKFDFHTIMGTLGQYPYLLRQLGLVVDLELDVTWLQLPDSVFPLTQVTVQCDWKSVNIPETDHPSPKTSTIINRDQTHITEFRIADSSDVTKSGVDVTRGLLKLGVPDLFEFSQIDIDGAGLKAGQMAAVLGRSDQGKGNPYLDAD